jgi:hypothetical protein
MSTGFLLRYRKKTSRRSELLAKALKTLAQTAKDPRKQCSSAAGLTLFALAMLFPGIYGFGQEIQPVKAHQTGAGKVIY